MGITEALKLENKLFKNKKESSDLPSDSPKMVKLNLKDNIVDFKFNYDKEWEDKDFLDVVEIMSVKSILYSVRNQPIVLSNGYSGYMQILEVYGKDLSSLSDYERTMAIVSFTQWLAGTTFDVTFQTTTLPTDTKQQITELARVLEEVEYALLNPKLSAQQKFRLNQRRDILRQNIITEEVVAMQQYNTEFFVWIFADTLEELADYTRTAQSISYGFQPHVVDAKKKEQILTQFYNYNDSQLSFR